MRFFWSKRPHRLTIRGRLVWLCVPARSDVLLRHGILACNPERADARDKAWRLYRTTWVSLFFGGPLTQPFFWGGRGVSQSLQLTNKILTLNPKSKDAYLSERALPWRIIAIGVSQHLFFFFCSLLPHAIPQSWSFHRDTAVRMLYRLRGIDEHAFSSSALLAAAGLVDIVSSSRQWCFGWGPDEKLAEMSAKVGSFFLVSIIFILFVISFTFALMLKVILSLTRTIARFWMQWSLKWPPSLGSPTPSTIRWPETQKRNSSTQIQNIGLTCFSMAITGGSR